MTPEKEKLWQMTIGRLIFAFGFIERYLNQLLAFWLAEEVYPHVESEPLSKRLRLAKCLVSSHSSDGVFIADLLALLQTIQELSEQRNMVAHNPVVLDANQLESGKWDMKQVIRHRKSRAKFLTLSELEKVALRAEEASQNLMRLMCEAVQQIMQGQHGKAGAPRLETIAKLLGGEPMGVSAEKPSL